MSITVKYFGALAEATGLTEETLDLADAGPDLTALRAFCLQKHGLKEDASIRLAVNQTLSQAATLQDGDEVAFLPPFAGG